MWDFLKKYWVEILVASVVLTLFISFAVAAPYLFPALAISTLSGGLVYGGATAFYVAIFAAITNGIRTRNQPDWPWFEGIIESPALSDVPHDSGELLKTEDPESLPLLDSSSTPAAPVHASVPSINVSDAVTDVPPRTSSVKNRIKVFQMTQQADAAKLDFKHETASTTITLTKIKEAPVLSPERSRIAAKKGDITPEFLSDIQAYYQAGNTSLTNLFATHPLYKKICEKNQLLDESGEDIKEDIKSTLLSKQ